MFDSIRLKLTLWYLAILALTVMGFSLIAYVLMSRALMHDTDERLVEMARNFDVSLKAELGEEGDGSAGDRAIAEVVSETRFRDYQFEVVDGRGEPVASTLETPAHFPALSSARFQTADLGNEPQRVYQGDLTNAKPGYRLIVLHALEEQNESLDRLAGILLIGVPITLILAGFGGYFLARKSLSPMVDMGRQAAAISSHNLSQRISIKNKKDELGDLAAVFNSLLGRLNDSFEQQRRFMADASHELRTPIAIVRGESEVAISRLDRESDEYRDSLKTVHDESLRLTRIVDDLFTLARADAGQFAAQLSQIYLDEVAGDVVRSMQILAQKKSIDLQFVCDAEMPFNGDEDLLRRMFTNVLDNAIKYSSEGGRVVIAGNVMLESYLITFADDGIGIPEADREKIFERFYRVDKSRSRGSDEDPGGAGLGLSIAAWIAELHHGSLTLRSTGKCGSVFQFDFPREGQPSYNSIKS